jgi:type IV pilus assembly protein PilM
MAKIKNYLGVDLGAGGIKVVNLAMEKKKISLVTYGFTERAIQEIEIDWFEDVEATSKLLKKICEKARTTTVQAVTALPISAVFSSVISLPAIVKEELEAAVKWEVKKLIPLPLEEVILDWKVLPSIPQSTPQLEKKEESKKEKTVEVLLTGAPKSLVDKYINLFKKAGLNLVSLETEAFAFIRALIGNDPTPTAIIDIGAKKSNIILVNRGIPYLSRSIEIGGRDFTKNIAQLLNLSLEKAEEMKRSISELQAIPNLPSIIKETLTPLINEIKYSLNVYQTRNHLSQPIEEFILTGGSSVLPHLPEYFTEFFNIRAFLGDPWARLSYPVDLKPLLQTIGSRFSVAIGLAMREL